MRHAVAAEVIKFLGTKISHQYGVLEFIHSDNGKQFVSQIFGELMTRYGIRHVKTGSGGETQVTGAITLPVEWEGETKDLEFLIVPGLTQRFYFGINF